MRNTTLCYQRVWYYYYYYYYYYYCHHEPAGGDDAVTDTRPRQPTAVVCCLHRSAGSHGVIV
eukprot:12771477-Heterocapsa_arctica.AAC.1